MDKVFDIFSSEEDEGDVDSVRKPQRKIRKVDKLEVTETLEVVEKVEKKHLPSTGLLADVLVAEGEKELIVLHNVKHQVWGRALPRSGSRSEKNRCG